jgi:outer membrane biosynthesis protein TonB
MPPDLRGRNLDTRTYVALDVDAEGKVAGCRVVKPSEDKRLDAVACRLLSERGRFGISYEGPGKPAPATRIMSVRWETIDSAERARRARMPIAVAPPAPPPPRFGASRVWPKLFHSDRLRPVSLPAIQADYPQGPDRPKEGIVSLDLLVSGPAGITGCEIGVGSGNAALDEAACRVARRLDLRYARTCEYCGEDRLPLQIVWRKRGSHIRLPLAMPSSRGGPPMLRDPADTRVATAYRLQARAISPAISPADFAKLPDKSHSVRSLRIILSIGANGRTAGCAIQTSSGNPAIDRRMCELLVRRARFEPRTDVFGDPVPSTQTLWIDLNTLL